MKRVKILSLGLSLALLMTGCTFGIDRDRGVSDTPGGNELTYSSTDKKPPKSIDQPEVDAYKAFLKKKLKKSNGSREDAFRAALIYLDEDDVYELAYLKRSGDAYLVYLYAYEDGQVVDLGIDNFPFYGEAGFVVYLEKKSCFYYEYENVQGEAAKNTEFIFGYEDGKVSLDHTVVTSTDFDTEETTYYIDDNEVTKDQYYEFNAEYNGYGYDGFININRVYVNDIYTEADLEKALSKDYATEYKNSELDNVFEVDKPVIYLYPEEDDTQVSVELNIDGYYTELIPEFNDSKGWTVTANRNGDIRLGEQTYDYLFWEAMLKAQFSFDEGFCVAGKDTEAFLEEALTEAGLNEKEKEQFIEYWLPLMENNEYNVISFQEQTYTDHARLHVSPEPDTTIRVFMAFYASDEFVTLQNQELSAPERSGFTVVEWGGAQLK